MSGRRGASRSFGIQRKAVKTLGAMTQQRQVRSSREAKLRGRKRGAAHARRDRPRAKSAIIRPGEPVSGARQDEAMDARDLLVTLVGLTSPGIAEKRTFIGPGTESCGAWTAARQAKGTRASFFEIWVLGYVSGQNWADADRPDFLAPTNVDMPGMMAWIDNYSCWDAGSSERQSHGFAGDDRSPRWSDRS